VNPWKWQWGPVLPEKDGAFSSYFFMIVIMMMVQRPGGSSPQDLARVML
jgi:hypothetical protein